jgi:hypothetical protein
MSLGNASMKWSVIKRRGIVVLLLCGVLVGVFGPGRFDGLHSRAAAPSPIPPARKQQYRVMKFICGLKCESARDSESLETTFVRDIIYALKFDTQNERRIARLPIGIFDDRSACDIAQSCDRVTIDMGARQLIVRCAAKEPPPMAAKKCNVPPKQQYLCTKSMLQSFAESIREHHLTVHQGN